MASNSATDADLPAVVDDILKGAAMSSLVEEDLVALVRDLRSARHAEQPPPSQLLPSPARPASHGEGMVAAGRHVANALGAGRSSSRAQQQRLLVVSRQPAEAGRVRTVLGLGHIQQRRPRGDACGRHQRGDGDDLFIGTPWPKTR